MRALEKRLGLSGLNYRAEEKVRHFKERIANVKSCVDSNPPRSLVEKEAKGGLSPSKKHVSAKERADVIALDNMLLAKRIFKIMDAPAPISSVINDTRHLQLGVTSMNFRSRLEETQRIHKRNLEFAERLEKVEPVYGYDDLHANRGMLEGRHKSTKKKSKMRKKDGMEDTGTDGFLTARSDGATLSPRGGDYGNTPRSAPGGTSKRILYESMVKREGDDVYVIVAKERNSDQYTIFGYSKASQRYEVRVTSEEISNLIDGDILVTSVERKEVWEALMPKVALIAVPQFGKFAGLSPEEYLRRKLSLPPSKSPSKPTGSAPSNRGGRAGRGVKKAKTAKELEEEEEQHNAATKLQAMHRAKLARKKVDFHKEMKKAAEEIGDSDEVHGAAAKLQAIHRGKMAKKHVEKKKEEKEQHQAAARLQAIHRGKSAKKEVQKKRDELEEQHQAAAKLQAIHRGKMAKQHVEKKKEEKEQHQAAARLQAIHRGKSAKKEVQKKKEELRISQEIGDSAEVHDAATKLQAVHRRKTAVKEVEEKKKEAEEKFRISQEIGDSAEVHDAATKLQAVHRRKAAVKEVEEKKKEAEEKAAKEAVERKQPRPPSTKKSGSAGGSRPSSKGRPGSRPSSKKSQKAGPSKEVQSRQEMSDASSGATQGAAATQKSKAKSTKDKGSKHMVPVVPQMPKGHSMNL